MTEMVEKLAACPVCRGMSFTHLATPINWARGSTVFEPYREQLALVRCKKCKFIFTNPRPAPALLDQFYSGETYDCHQYVASDYWEEKAAASRLRFLAPFCKRDAGRLLDFGCGNGYFLRVARALGWKDPVGFDIGQHAVATCQEQGLTVTDRIDWLKEQGGFDLITLNHVFEHVSDLGSLLGLFKTLLRPCGTLFIEVPNAKSLRAGLSAPFFVKHCRFDERFRAFPTHPYYFAKDTLRHHLEQHGFTVHASTTEGVGWGELIRRKQAPAQPVGRASPLEPQPQGGWNPSRTLKAFAKGSCRVLSLGENLRVVARAGQERAT
jgi:2-polyprenyl-3-methyl-5-hydroxy-6-metoxy-1,4-benzoquinol methylase